MVELTVIIPTLNEAKNISWVIDTVVQHVPSSRIIVSDDGSKDGTQKIIQAYQVTNNCISLLDRSKKIHGLTASVVDAISNTKTSYFAVIDGDGQHPPEKLVEILNALLQGNEIAVATREKVASEWTFWRRLMSKCATGMAFLRLMLTGTLCNDPVSGFFGGNTLLVQKAIQQHHASFVLEGYKVLFDLLKIRKWRLAEVSYTFGVRKGGTSKIARKHIVAFLRSIIL